MTQKVYVFGHSHVWSVRRVVKRDLAKGFEFQAPICGTKEMPGPLVYQDNRQRYRLTSVLTALLNRLKPEPDVSLLSMVQGNYYNQIGMLNSGSPFDFIVPDRPELPFDDAVTHIPFWAVKAAMEAQMEHLSVYLRRLKVSEFGAQTLIAGTSPPPEDSAYFEPMLLDQGLMPQLSSPHVRLKLWLLQDAVYADLCRTAGLTYVSAEIAETQNDTGYLKTEFVKDAVHANGEWAALYLKKVANVISQSKENSDV